MKRPVRVQKGWTNFSRWITLRPMASKSKGARIVITLECTEARKLGQPPSRYHTTKNKKKHPGRLELKKYNPFLRRHTVHKETK